MVSHMKTTVQIPDSLMKEIRQLSHEEQTTLKALMEEGLRHVISEHRQRGRFRLRKATFKGKGLQSQLDAADWNRIRDLGHEGRGA
jgi:hypothetical protein